VKESFQIGVLSEDRRIRKKRIGWRHSRLVRHVDSIIGFAKLFGTLMILGYNKKHICTEHVNDRKKTVSQQESRKK
jgi:hypothetical protein